jgi:3-hydroxyacyl-CoA dehydrogenase
VHPANPPYLLPIAEVVPAPFTTDATVDRVRRLLTASGMMPILVGKETEGFVFNRLQGALLREAYCLVRDGVATPPDIDAVVSLGLGRRWAVIGPFATAELNTRGGVRRHAELLGPAYARMGAERGQRDMWTPELVTQVAEATQRSLAPKEWDANVARRDRALMRLESARRADPEPFMHLAGRPIASSDVGRTVEV